MVSISHDLNSPISNNSGIIRALNSTMHSDNIEERGLADMLTYSINKLKETVAEIADITKIE
ncbi:MAG: hypothetical protein M3421_13865 [Bacteroidota bacterium]|nr:hypothetical protein [Bacteroidota bacterium]